MMTMAAKLKKSAKDYESNKLIKNHIILKAETVQTPCGKVVTPLIINLK